MNNSSAFKEKSIPVIGVFVDSLHSEYQSRIWEGMMEGARESGVGLLSFTGGFLSSSDNGGLHARNLLYNLASESSVDGIIYFGPPLKTLVGEQGYFDFCRGFDSLPSLHIGIEGQNGRGITVDNTAGMRELIEHFIINHKYTNIAFIGGPPGNADADQRYQIYRDVLEQNGIPYRDDLVWHGDYLRESGSKAVEVFLDERKISFDAVIAANDYMALYAMVELQHRGYQIPEEIAVAGFDNLYSARSHSPALTTVSQPVYEMGRIAVTTFAKELQSNPRIFDPVSIILPTRMIVRRSCGCLSAPRQFADMTPVAAESMNDSMFSREEKIKHIFDGISPNLPEYFGFELALILEHAQETGNTSPLFYNLENIISKICENEMSPSSLYQPVQELFRLYEGKLSKELELKCTSYIGIIHEEILSRALTEEKERSSFLSVFAADLFGTFDHERIKTILSRDFPKMRARRFSLVLFKNHEQRDSCTEFFCNNQNPYDAEFPTVDIVPGGVRAWEKPFTAMVFPLCDETRYFGYFITEVFEQEAEFFETLASHIGVALKGSHLVQDIRNYAEQLEKRVEERTLDLQTAMNELKESNEQIARLLIFDELTGLYNRRGFFTLARQQIELAKRKQNDFLLFYIGISNLKSINSAKSHAAGDLAIKEMGSILVEAFRQTDIVARMGSDEFAVLAINCTVKEYEGVLRRIETTVKKFNNSKDAPFSLSYSYGMAPYDEKRGYSLEEMLCAADESRLESKDKGI